MKASGTRTSTWISGRDELARAAAAASGTPARARREGVIAGMVTRSARRRAGLTRRALARRLGIPAAIIRQRENGAVPLFAVDYPVLARLTAATCSDLRELLIAGQCDLLLAGLLDGTEDFADVPPLDEDTPGGQTARTLLRRACGQPVPDEPHRRRPRRARPRLPGTDITRIAGLARELAAGSRGDDLARFGAALLDCVTGNHSEPGRPDSGRPARPPRPGPQQRRNPR